MESGDVFCGLRRAEMKKSGPPLAYYSSLLPLPLYICTLIVGAYLYSLVVVGHVILCHVTMCASPK
jgi:hypothetical protein